MLFDRHGLEIQPIWYNRGTGIVSVRYLSGIVAIIPVSEITSHDGPAFTASVIRNVRVP